MSSGKVLRNHWKVFFRRKMFIWRLPAAHCVGMSVLWPRKDRKLVGFQGMPHLGFVPRAVGPAVRDGSAFWPGFCTASGMTGRAVFSGEVSDQSRTVVEFGRSPHTNCLLCIFHLLQQCHLAKTHGSICVWKVFIFAPKRTHTPPRKFGHIRKA